jgi:hypothetical protein
MFLVATAGQDVDGILGIIRVLQRESDALPQAEAEQAFAFWRYKPESFSFAVEYLKSDDDQVTVFCMFKVANHAMERLQIEIVNQNLDLVFELIVSLLDGPNRQLSQVNQIQCHFLIALYLTVSGNLEILDNLAISAKMRVLKTDYLRFRFCRQSLR